MARITRDELQMFIRWAIQDAARRGVGITRHVSVRGEVTIEDGCVKFNLDDGSLVAIDPEWLVPRNYGEAA